MTHTVLASVGAPDRRLPVWSNHPRGVVFWRPSNLVPSPAIRSDRDRIGGECVSMFRCFRAVGSERKRGDVLSFLGSVGVVMPGNRKRHRTVCEKGRRSSSKLLLLLRFTNSPYIESSSFLTVWEGERGNRQRGGYGSME